jgi:hypothetical protein
MIADEFSSDFPDMDFIAFLSVAMWSSLLVVYNVVLFCLVSVSCRLWAFLSRQRRDG